MMGQSWLGLHNTSTGARDTFVIEGWPKDETNRHFLERVHPDIVRIIRTPRIEVEGIHLCPSDTSADPIDIIREFAEQRHEDAEWDLPKGLLYADWFDICEAIGIEVDWEDIQFDEVQVFVKDQDSRLIDDAIENLHHAGWDLPVHRHVILNGYDSYYEVSE